MSGARIIEGLGQALDHAKSSSPDTAPSLPLTAESIAHLEKKLDAAMAGDWFIDESDRQPWGIGVGAGGYTASAPVCSSANQEDADLIVSLRNAAPELLSMARRCADAEALAGGLAAEIDRLTAIIAEREREIDFLQTKINAASAALSE